MIILTYSYLDFSLNYLKILLPVQKDHEKIKTAFKIKGRISEQATQSLWSALVFQGRDRGLGCRMNRAPQGMERPCPLPPAPRPAGQQVGEGTGPSHSGVRHGAWRPWGLSWHLPIPAALSPVGSENHALGSPSKSREMPQLWVQATESLRTLEIRVLIWWKGKSVLKRCPGPCATDTFSAKQRAEQVQSTTDHKPRAIHQDLSGLFQQAV